MNRSRISAWKKILLAICALMLWAVIFVDDWLGEALVPIIEKTSGSYQYPVKIGRIDSELYNGSLSLSDVRFVDGSQIAMLRLQWPWRSMLSGEIRLGRVSLRGLQLGPDFFKRLPASQEPKPAGETGTAVQAMPVMIELIEILNSELHIQSKQQSARLAIPRLRIEGAGSPERPEWHVLGKLAASMTGAARKVELSELEIDGELSAVLAKKAWTYSGSTDVSGLAVQDADTRARLEGLRLKGELTADMTAMQAGYKGKLDIRGLEVSLADQSLTVDNLATPLQLSAQKKAEVFDWRVAALTLSGPIRLSGRFGENKLPETTIEHLRLSALDSRKAEQPADISLEVALGRAPEIGRLQAEGSLTLLKQPMYGKLTSDMELEAAPLSAFAEANFGLSLDSGRMTMHSDIQFAGESIKADNHVLMRRFRVSKADEGLAARLTRSIGISPDAALDLLRDSHDQIKLHVPVSLQMKDGASELQTDLSAIYAAAMLGAMRKAALSYVKNLFQPYGMAIDALQWLGEAGTRMRLAPVFFKSGLVAATPETEEGRKKVAGLLRRHARLNVAICAVVARDEAELLGGKDAWRKLATERVQWVINDLLERGVSREQLTLCKNRIDEGAGAKPRVEVLL